MTVIDGQMFREVEEKRMEALKTKIQERKQAEKERILKSRMPYQVCLAPFYLFPDHRLMTQLGSIESVICLRVITQSRLMSEYYDPVWCEWYSPPLCE